MVVVIITEYKPILITFNVTAYFNSMKYLLSASPKCLWVRVVKAALVRKTELSKKAWPHNEHLYKILCPPVVGH